MYNTKMDDTIRRVDELYFKIIACNQDHQRDLKRMWRSCKDIITEISKEDVTCRRKGRDTVTKLELVTQLEQSINTLEQYLVFATLLNG
jgi:hypothetical protein